MRQKLQVTMIILIVILGGLYFYSEQTGASFKDFFNAGTKTARLNNVPLTIIIADTPEERQQGLSGREDLEGQGMLFVFDENDYHGIWMKDMRFPIDIIWIAEDKTIVEITKNVTPETYPAIFKPPRPVRYVIETNPYFAESFGIKVGDTVELPSGL